jgi:hypothetical protein
MRELDIDFAGFSSLDPRRKENDGLPIIFCYFMFLALGGSVRDEICIKQCGAWTLELYHKATLLHAACVNIM